MWAASGLPLPELFDRVIQTALRKRPGGWWPHRGQSGGDWPRSPDRPEAGYFLARSYG